MWTKTNYHQNGANNIRRIIYEIVLYYNSSKFLCETDHDKMIGWDHANIVKITINWLKCNSWHGTIIFIKNMSNTHNAVGNQILLPSCIDVQSSYFIFDKAITTWIIWFVHFLTNNNNLKNYLSRMIQNSFMISFNSMMICSQSIKPSCKPKIFKYNSIAHQTLITLADTTDHMWFDTEIYICCWVLLGKK